MSGSSLPDYRYGRRYNRQGSRVKHKTLIRRWLPVLFLLLFIPLPFNGQSLENGLEIEGLVLDRTRTKLGSDFYDIFYSRWDPPAEIKGFNITITEKPIPRMGTLIQVDINSKVVYRQRLTPRYADIEKKAEQAAYISLRYLYNYDQYKSQLSNEDLKGSGIY